jgi:hypothetical protein
MSMNGMRKSLIVLSLVYVVALALSISAQQPPRDGPRYRDGTSLVRPTDYREWPFLGSGLGLTYEAETPRAGDAPPFTNVFVNPSSYRAFMQTGTWPNETVFVLESRRSQTNAAPNVGGPASAQGFGAAGRFQGDLLGIEAEVKDLRFPDGWGFFNFGRAGALADVAAPLTGDAVASCVDCHTKHTAVERTFVQFYPTLLEVARQKRTLKPGF